VEPAPSRAWFRFYAELNDHLAPGLRYRTQEKTFFVPGSVKDAIESFGVPHSEVELILINGESVEFSSLVRDGDRVAVYPVFESFDVSSKLRVRPQPLRDPRFVLDVHLGRLAGYLRMLGFDAAYANRASDPDLVRVSSEQKRILLTRDRGLLRHAAVTRGYWVREIDARRQAFEIVRRFDLARALRPFTRCMACNTALRSADKAAVLQRLPARAAELHDRFLECPGCGRVYWEGSHYRRMRQWIGELAGAAPD
jgi:uncharacterized protein with PIN domain